MELHGGCQGAAARTSAGQLQSGPCQVPASRSCASRISTRTASERAPDPDVTRLRLLLKTLVTMSGVGQLGSHDVAMSVPSM
jgi:hypothetical protein